MNFPLFIGALFSLQIFYWIVGRLALTAVISIAAIFFAFYFDNIVDLLIQSYELSVSCLFVPLIFGLFKRKGNFLPAFVSILLGALSFCVFLFYPITFPKEIASLAISLVGYMMFEFVWGGITL